MAEPRTEGGRRGGWWDFRSYSEFDSVGRVKRRGMGYSHVYRKGGGWWESMARPRGKRRVEGGRVGEVPL